MCNEFNKALSLGRTEPFGGSLVVRRTSTPRSFEKASPPYPAPASSALMRSTSCWRRPPAEDHFIGISLLRRLPAPRSCLQAFPGHQYSLGLGRVLPDSADGEAIQANFAGDRDVALMIEQIHDPRELFAAIRWLSPQIDAISVGLRVGDTGLLGEPRRLGLRLPERRHERDQRVPYCLFHRVGGGAVEGHVVDDGPDHDAAPHERPDGIDHILVVPT